MEKKKKTSCFHKNIKLHDQSALIKTRNVSEALTNIKTENSYFKLH